MPSSKQWREAAVGLRAHAAKFDQLAEEAETQELNQVQPSELVRLLNAVDGQLGLAIYRGADSSNWKEEASALIDRIRATISALRTDA